jgi:hypothetical protein
MINSLRRTWPFLPGAPAPRPGTTADGPPPAGRPGPAGGPQGAGALAPPSRSAQVLGLLAIAGIGLALLVMVGASAIRQDWMLPRLPMPAVGPPFELRWVHLGAGAVDTALWLAEIIGVLGVLAGLLAAARGARPPMRLIVVTAIVVVAALTLLPPAGSTDALDYATYGRLLVLGHNPYIATPSLLRNMHNTFAHSVPREWSSQVSLYGPFATFEQLIAAKLGGISMARIVFWLKLWNSVTFAAVAIILDRMLRADPAQRLRAHLLWTLNPLLLWDLIAAGHVDMLAAAAGLGGLLAIGRQAPGTRVRLWRAAMAGALIGVSADIKINYILLAGGLAWALRRSPAALLSAAAGGLAVLVPTYAWLGQPAARALLARRDKASADSFYRLLTGDVGLPRHLVFLAGALVALLAILLLRRMPAADPLRPALRPALALAVAWLFIWPYQLPWYDAIFICILVLYPATRLDWLVLLRLTVATISNTPGIPAGPPGHALKVLDRFAIHAVAPVALLASVVILAALAVSGRWGWRHPPRLTPAPGRAPAAPAPALSPAPAPAFSPAPAVATVTATASGGSGGSGSGGSGRDDGTGGGGAGSDSGNAGGSAPSASAAPVGT